MLSKLFAEEKQNKLLIIVNYTWYVVENKYYDTCVYTYLEKKLNILIKEAVCLY